MNALKNPIISYVSFASVLIIGILFVLPQLRGIQKDARVLLETRTEFEAMELQQQDLQDFINFEQEHLAEIRRFEDMFVDPKTPIDFLQFVERVGAESGLHVAIIPANPQQLEGDPWPSLEFQVKSTGSFQAIVAFLQKFERAPYALEFKNFSLNRSQEDVRKVLLVMSVKTYTK